MKVVQYHIDDQGNLLFLMASKDFGRVLDCLRSKGVNAGGTENADALDCSQIIVELPDKVNEAIADFIDKVNEALADLPE